jgi:hypothetical protein
METAERRLHTIIAGLLVPAVLFGAIKLSPLLASWSLPKFAGALLGAAVASAATYRGLVFGINWLLRRSEFIKKRMLGPAYLNGTWVGWYRGADGNIKYVVEIVEQTFTSVLTRGEAFDDAGTSRGDWVSEAMFVAPARAQLVYTCNAQFNSVGTPSRSLVVFKLERKENTAAPDALDGFVTDVHNGNRTKVREEKLQDKPMAIPAALGKAKERYQQALKAGRA